MAQEPMIAMEFGAISYRPCRDGKITYPGTGDEMREYINVKDAARLTIDILSPEYKNRHIVVTGHHPMKTRDMLEMIKEMLKKDITFEFSTTPHELPLQPHSLFIHTQNRFQASKQPLCRYGTGVS